MATDELHSLLTISQQMLVDAQAGHWDKLPDLESKRNELMHVFFEQNGPAVAYSHEQIKQTIEAVLRLNKKIAQLAQQEKNGISQQLHGMKKKQNVHSAYLQNK